MRFIKNGSIIFLGLLLFCCNLTAQDVQVKIAQTGSDRLGLVKDKPASGRYVETPQGFMVPYSTKIPGTEVEFEMVPVPGGTFKMGSPLSEPDRLDDEGPQLEVTVEPFWMGKHEVTWAEYKRYMRLHDIFKSFESKEMRRFKDEKNVDVITAPSNLYDPSFTFMAGKDPRHPAATMTQYAAKQYTKWLSLISKDFFRLPLEAEWEYACRAGTTTAYSFGDDPEKLTEYGWFDDNSDFDRQLVGQKKPNQWGLYDMHGNVAEWVLDEYSEKGYERFAGKKLNAIEMLTKPTKLYPRVVRGGSFELALEDCRCASRLGSEDEEWKEEDPNVPKSPWWYTSEPATGVGFRIIRPLNVPDTREGKEFFWEADMAEIKEDAVSRVREEGRGAIGLVDPDLPDAIKSISKRKRKK